MLGRSVSSAVSAFGPFAVILLVLILASGLTPVVFRILQAVNGSDTGTETRAAPANPSAEPPPTHPSKTNRPEFPNAGAYVRHELESTIIPKVDFENAHVEEALDFLRQRFRELGPQEDIPRGISFILRKPRFESLNKNIDAELDAEGGLGDSEDEWQTITWQAENVSVFQALEEVTRQAGLQFRITRKGLLEIIPHSKRPTSSEPPPPDPNDPFTGASDPFRSP